MALIQLGKLHGLRVLCTASGAKHDFVRSLGAEPIDYQRQDFVAAVAKLTQGRGVDAVFDTISFSNFQRSFACLNATGYLVAYGVYQATIGTQQKQVGKVLREVLPFFAAKLWWRLTQPKKRSAFYIITAERKKHPEQFKQDLGTLLAWAAAGKLQPIVAARLPLAQAAQAHEMVEKAQTRGKIVLLMP
jgi:NADPH:quinone reductase-like Zn-dependent oxidoreductase